MPNYPNIQKKVDSKLRKNGISFEIKLSLPDIYDPTTGNALKQNSVVSAYGIKTTSENKQSNSEVRYGDYILMLSTLDIDGNQYPMPKRGSVIMIDGKEVEVVNTVVELNLTDIPLYYNVVLRGI